jgi:glycosyltransferase involved in cell wall biosynthesis
MVDPSAFTPPYDRSLASALASRGVEVDLLTSRFLHGPVPDAAGFRVSECFYRRTSARGPGARFRLPFKAAEHLVELPRFGRVVGDDQDLVHYQWLTWPALDRFFLPGFRPRVMTAHHVPPGGRALRNTVRLLGSMDRAIVHTDSSRERLVEAGLDPARVTVVAHGAFDYLTQVAPAPLPEPLADTPPDRPVVLFFGLIRPYKGLDLLIEAMESVPEAELWVVGNPRLPPPELDSLRRRAEALPGGSRWVTRFIDETEIRPVMERADLMALPYREADQSGVLYAGLAFGMPMVVTDVGGPGEVARRTGAALAVEPDDPAALAAAIGNLVADREARADLGRQALEAARTTYSWEKVAEATLAVYEDAIEVAGR